MTRNQCRLIWIIGGVPVGEVVREMGAPWYASLTLISGIIFLTVEPKK